MKRNTTIVLFLALVMLAACPFTMQSRSVVDQSADAITAATEPVEQAEIKFDTLRINLGTFAENDGPQKCTFNFTNVGDAPLIIHQAHAACGCTVPSFTKDPVMPGETGKLDVTYNGKGKFPGYFSKTITLRTNAKTEVIRLIIEGTMTK